MTRRFSHPVQAGVTLVMLLNNAQREAKEREKMVSRKATTECRTQSLTIITLNVLFLPYMYLHLDPSRRYVSCGGFIEA